VSVVVYAFFDGEIVYTSLDGALIKALGSLTIPLSINDMLCSSGDCQSLSNVFALLTFQPEDNSIPPSDNFFFFTPLNKVTLEDPVLTTSLFTQISPTQIVFSVSSISPAPLVWLESPFAGYFSDNGFTLPGLDTQKVVTFFSEQNIRAQDLQSSLTVTSIYDTY